MLVKLVFVMQRLKISKKICQQRLGGGGGIFRFYGVGGEFLDFMGWGDAAVRKGT